jgi:RNA polymerase sigma factor (sigma-70 family)
MSQTTLLRYIQRLGTSGENCSWPDAELLERFVRDGSEDAFGMLVRRHGRLVWGVCRRMLYREQDAEDAFQATFVVLTNKAASLRHPEMLGSWLFGVARRIALKARSRGKPFNSLEGALPASGDADPLAAISARELLDILDEELARLPDRYRAPLILCCLEGKTRDEAAKLLGWSVSSVKGRLERGRQLLEQRLTRRGIALSAALAVVLVCQTTAAGAVPAALVGATVQSGLAKAALTSSVAALSHAACRMVLWESMRTWLVIGLASCLLLAGLGVAYSIRAGDTGNADVPLPPPMVERTAEHVAAKGERTAEHVAAKDERLPEKPPLPERPAVQSKKEIIVIEGVLRSIDAKAKRITIVAGGDGVESGAQTLSLASQFDIQTPTGIGELADLTRTNNARLQVRLTAEPREVVGITLLPRKKRPPEKGKG